MVVDRKLRRVLIRLMRNRVGHTNSISDLLIGLRHICIFRFPLSSLYRVLSHRSGAIDTVQFEVKPARVADRLFCSEMTEAIKIIQILKELFSCQQKSHTSPNFFDVPIKFT